MKLIKDKKFYGALAALALPIALQDLIKFGLNMVDNVMVGSLSEVEISAVSMANQPFFIFSMLVFGLTSGGIVLSSQYHGRGDINSVNKVVSITMTFATSVGALFTALVLIFPAQAIAIFTDEQAVIAAGVEYIRYVGWAYVCYAVTTCCIMMLRSVKIMRPTLIINIISFFMNVCLNWVFIFGNLGAPRMGIAGAALATLIARAFEAISCLLYLRFRCKLLTFRFSKILPLSKPLVLDFFRYCLPVTSGEFLWGLGTAGISMILGRLGTEAMAASSIINAISGLLFVLLYGLSNATCILVGNATGRGDGESAKRIGDTLMLFNTLVGVLVGIVMILLRDVIPSFYNISELSRQYTVALIWIDGIFTPIHAIGLTVITGVLRGGGDTKFAMFCDTLPLWLLTLPLGFICAFVLHSPVPLVFLVLRADSVVRAVVGIIRCRGTKWIKNVTRSNPGIESGAED